VKELRDVSDHKPRRASLQAKFHDAFPPPNAADRFDAGAADFGDNLVRVHCMAASLRRCSGTAGRNPVAISVHGAIGPPMFRFSIRHVLWLMVVVALALGWCLQDSQLKEQENRLVRFAEA
jgi:hypothetical protein